MSEIEKLMKDIEDLRNNLYEVINKKQADLQDSDVISASKMLNEAITRYNDILSKKLKDK